MKKTFSICLIACVAVFCGGCDMFSEGDPVDAKTGIVGKWQDDQNPALIMEFDNSGSGKYINNDQIQEITFKYIFVDDDTVKATFENGNELEFDVKTTTRYLWMSDEDGINRLHKM